MKRWNRDIGCGGVTLVELIVAIVIAAILITAGLPALLPLIRNSRIDGAARQVMYEIRAVQNLAVTRGDVFGFQWGGDPTPPGTGRLNSEYRIVRDTTGACGFPAPGAPMDGTDVVRTWFDLAGEYPGVTIQSVQDSNSTVIGGIMFNSRGASVNTCAAVAFPLTVTIADTGGATRTIEIQRAGRVRIL